MTDQLELPHVRAPARAVEAAAAKRLGVQQWWCTACGFEGEHTGDQCVAMRPVCHVPGCDRVTCIQARHHGKAPTCLDHFFGCGPDWRKVIPDA